MMMRLAWLLLSMGSLGCKTSPALEARAQAGAYTCSMHPQISQVGEGMCPLCGMALIEKKNTESTDERHVLIKSDMVFRLGILTNPVVRQHPQKRLNAVGRVVDDGIELLFSEADAKALVVGRSIPFTARAHPDEVLTASVTSIKRGTVRANVTRGSLAPGALIDASIKTGDEGPLVIPDTAPLFAGKQSLVYVATSRHDGFIEYEARIVRLGNKQANLYPVLAGLLDNEVLVTSGAFVVDSELQLRGGLSMTRLNDQSSPYDRAQVLPAQLQPQVQSLLEAYLDITHALAADRLEPVPALAAQMLRASATLHMAATLESNIRLLQSAGSVKVAREALAGVFEPLAEVLRVYGNATGSDVRLVFCPMAFSKKGARWLQREAVIANPYFGDSMQTCGNIEATVKRDDHLGLSH